MPRLMEKGSDIWSKSSEPVTDRHQLKFFIVSVPGTICTPHQFSINQAQKHSETALDTLFFLGVASTSTAKVHAILANFSKVLPISCKCYISVIHL